VAAGSVARILRNPGRLVVGPTDLTTPYPYGGTEIGHARTIALRSTGAAFLIESEILGEPTDVLHGDHRWELACFLRGFDDDAIRVFFPGRHETGETTRHAMITMPGDRYPGESMVADAVSLLYVPDAGRTGLAVHFYRVVARIEDGAEIALSRHEEMGIPVLFTCLRDDEDHLLRILRMPDLEAAWYAT